MLTDAQRAALVLRLRRGRENGTGQVPRRPAGLTDLPLSFGQEQLWFIDRFAPGLPTYNIPLALRLSGAVDVAALGRAVDGLLARHEALRTRLVADAGGRPVQVIDPPGPVRLGREDLSGHSTGDRLVRLGEFISEVAVRPFSLAADRLLRAWLVWLGGSEHVMVVVVHHAVFDGWSAGVLVRELAALYGQEAGGEPAGLAGLPVQFADYALWERGRMRGELLAELEGYWRGVLDGFETVQFPADRPRPVIDDFSGGLTELMTGLDLLDGLRELSRREGTTLFITLMAGLLALLYRYTGQADLVVGTLSANRSRSELAPLIGFLVNTLPIRADVSGDPVFTDLMARVRERTVGAYAHQDLPFGKMIQTLAVERDPGRAPVFQIAFSYAERDRTPVTAAGVEFALTDLVAGINAAKFDLTLTAEARPGGLWLECSYKTALFDEVTVRRLLGHLEVLLRGAVADPSARLSQLPVLTETELRRELDEWNDTAAPVPLTCIHHRFEEQAAQTPDAVAAEYADEQITYADLNRQANQIARLLREFGIGPEVLAGVCMTTGLRRLAALLGILKAGGGYVPLDPALPAQRLAYMITDTAMKVLLTDEPSAASISGTEAVTGPASRTETRAASGTETGAAVSTGAMPGRAAGTGLGDQPGRDEANMPDSGQVTVLSLDAEWDQIRGLDDTDLDDTAVTPSNVAYVIYTSGSTGQPKGVVVEHRQAINFLHGMIAHWQIGPADAVLQFASFTFDVSVMDMFMPLLAGARVVLASAQTLHSPPRLAALIPDRRVTFACLPPAVLGLLTGQDFPDLRTLMAAGEELPAELARRWIRPGLRLVNGYGPTEATVIATYQELDATMIPPPIGRPSRPNYRAYILDPDLNPVPIGVTGELHIGGHGIARGYLNRPDLTRQRFIPDPFTPGQRLYKTGDLARRRPDGIITYAGRTDYQVKIRGLRIELGEIETALTTHPAIAQAVVTVTTTPATDHQLTAYLRPEPPTQPGHADPHAGLDLADVRAHLARTLPAYMIPAHLIPIDTFPLSTSGKIDRSALPPPAYQAFATVHTAPTTFIETVLADIYATILGHDHVSATDSFFDLGGSSLAVMRLVTQLGAALGVDLDVSAVFLAPTPQQLAAVLRDRHGLDDADLDADGSPLTTAAR